MFESIKRLFAPAPAATAPAAAPPPPNPSIKHALNDVLKGVTSTLKKVEDKAQKVTHEVVAEAKAIWHNDKPKLGPTAQYLAQKVSPIKHTVDKAKAVWNNDKPKLGPTGQYLAQKLSPLKHKVDQAATALNNEAAKVSHATQHVAQKAGDITHKVVGDVKTAWNHDKAILSHAAQYAVHKASDVTHKVVAEAKTALNSKPAVKDIRLVQVAHAEPGKSAAARSQPGPAKPQAGPAPLEAFKPPTRAQVQARQDAIELYQAGIARMGTDEKKITDILKSYNPQQMETLRQQYRAEYDRELDADLKSEYGIVKHDIADLFAGTKNEQAELKVLLQGTAGADAQKPRGHAAAKEDAADQLMRAMKGWGTDEELIGQVLQGKQKAEIDQIAADYEKRYGKSLHQSLVDEISPNSTDYKKLIEQDFKLGAVDFNKPAEAAKELARRSQELLDYQPRYTRVLQDAAERTWNAIINDGIEGPLRTSREQAQYDLDRVQQHLSQGQAGPAALQAGVTRRQVDVVQETQQDMAKAAAYTAASLAGGFAGVAVRGAMGAAAGTLAGQAASGAASVGAGMVAGGATYGTLNPHAGAEEITRQSVLSGVAGGSALAGTSLGSAVTLPQMIGAGAKVGFSTGAAHGALDAATDQVSGQHGAGQWARTVAERAFTEGTTGALTLGTFGGLKYGMGHAPVGVPPANRWAEMADRAAEEIQPPNRWTAMAAKAAEETPPTNRWELMTTEAAAETKVLPPPRVAVMAGGVDEEIKIPPRNGLELPGDATGTGRTGDSMAPRAHADHKSDQNVNRESNYDTTNKSNNGGNPQANNDRDITQKSSPPKSNPVTHTESEKSAEKLGGPDKKSEKAPEVNKQHLNAKQDTKRATDKLNDRENK